MSETSQITQRVVAALRRRETIRIAAPAAAAVVVVGVLLGVFLTGGSETGEPSGQTVAIAERTADTAGADTVEPAADAESAAKQDAAAAPSGSAPEDAAGADAVEPAADAEPAVEQDAAAVSSDSVPEDAAGADTVESAADAEAAAKQDAAVSSELAPEGAAGADAVEAATGAEPGAADEMATASAADDATAGTDTAGEGATPAAVTGAGAEPADGQSVAAAPAADDAASVAALEDSAVTKAVEAGDAATPPSFDTVRISPDGRAEISGRAEPGARVTVRSGPNEIGSVTADRHGEWELQSALPLPPGDHEFSVAETLPDGRRVEAEQMAVLSVPDPASGDGEGETVAAGEAGDAATPPSFDTVRISPDGRAEISGRAEPGARVTVRSGPNEIGSVTADRHGEWELQSALPLPPGDHEFSVAETLPDGRRVEAEQMAVLSVPDPASGDGEGETVAAGEAGDAATPPSFDTVRISPDGRAEISGRAEPGARVTVRSGPNEIGSVTADRHGEWELQSALPLPPGDHEFSVAETLPDGRRVEAEQMAVLSVPDPASGDGEGETVAAGEAGDAVTPPSFDTVRISPDGMAVIAGRAEPGADVTVRSESHEIGSVTADRRGEWALVSDMPIPPGDHEFSAVATAPDGTQVESTHVLVVSIPARGSEDTTPFAALLPRDGEGKIEIVQKPDPPPEIVDEPEPVPEIAEEPEPAPDTAEEAEEVEVAVAGPDEGSAGEARPRETQPDQTRPVEAPADAAPMDEARLQDGDNDGAGADEPVTGTAPEAIGEAPAAPPEGEDEGPLALGTVDYDDEGDMTLAGKADPDAALNVYLDDRHVGTVESDEVGDWEVTPDDEVEPGSYTLRVDQVDPAGVVLLRIETPLVRAKPEELSFGDAIVVVQPGNSLWRIARRTLGGGVHFTEIYEANRSQIADPALIYPGQIFTVPHLDEG